MYLAREYALSDLVKRFKKKCSVCSNWVFWEGVDFEKDRPLQCPHCASFRFEKPKMETQLFTLQEKFLATRDQKTLGEMYLIMLRYARNGIVSRLKNKHSLCDDTVDSKSEDAATSVVAYYLRNPAFRIDESFGAYIIGAVNYQLYYKRFKDIDSKEVSISTPLGSDSDSSSLEDQLSQTPTVEAFNHIEFFEKEKVTFLLEECEEWIDLAFKVISKHRGTELAILSLVLLSFYLKKSREAYFTRAYNVYGVELQEIFEKFQLEFRHFLSNQARPRKEGS